MSWYRVTYQENGKIKHKKVHQEALDSLGLNIIEKKRVRTFSFRYTSKLPFKEVVSFFRELDIILQADMLFLDALNILYESTTHPKMKKIIQAIQDAIHNGQPIDEQLLPYRQSLGFLPLAFFKIAQNNGNLKTAMNSLVIILTHLEQSKKKIINALLYPLILAHALLFLLLFTFYFLLPKFEMMFQQYGNALPLATQLLLGLKQWVHDYFLLSCLGVGGVIFYLVYFYATKKWFAYKVDKILALKIPWFSQLLHLFVFQRFFLSLKILLNDHYKFQTALVNSKVLISNIYLQEELEQINQQIQSGKSILCAFKNSCLFNDLILRLLSVGEQSHTLDKTIQEIEKIYQKRLDESIKNVTTFLEPLFFIIIASIIVWIMLAIFMPIWSLGETMGM